MRGVEDTLALLSHGGCRARRGGEAGGSDADATFHCVAGTADMGVGTPAVAAAEEEERDAEARRRVRVATRAGAEGRERGAMGGGMAYINLSEGGGGARDERGRARRSVAGCHGQKEEEEG